MKKKMLSLLVLSGLMAMKAEAKVVLKKVEYIAGDQTFEAVVAMDSAVKGKKPGIVVFHNWMGVTGETESKITELAKLGYVAMAADVYGKGIRPKDVKEAGALAGKYKNDRKELRNRAILAFEELKKNSHVDSSKLFATGYCFGGTTALELARSGAPLLGTVSFHGGLSNPAPAEAKNIKGQVLIFHGAVDPYVPAEEVAAFKKEMDESKVPYELVMFANTVHSFTEKAAGNDISKGAAYNETADKRSWEAMRSFFVELAGLVKK